MEPLASQPGELSVAPPERERPAPAAQARLRLRVYLLGTAALLLNQFWLMQAELVRWSLFTNVVPYCNAIFTLVVLLLLNEAAARLTPNRAPWLTRAELLCVFTMLCIGSALGAQQMMQLLVAALVYPARYVGFGNHWQNTFVRYLPHWAMVTDRQSVDNFYNGNSSLYRPENFRPWLVPILFWCVFAVTLLWTMLCINAILRRFWTAAERLSFPTVYLPLEMSSGPAFWRNRLLWLGFALAGGVTFWNGLAYLFPNLPMIPIKREDISKSLFPVPPWSGIGSLQTSFYFFAVGIAFLMPQDLSFSLWFFYLRFKLELVTITALGWDGIRTSGAGFDNQPPYDSGQAFGAYVAVFLMTVWAMRSYLRDVWRTAFGRGPKPLDDSGEPLRYRTAFLGGLTGFLLLAGLCTRLGMSAWIAVLFFAIYFVLAVMITRIRAEFGFPVHDMHHVGPLNLLVAGFGPRGLGPTNLAAFSQTYWFNRTYFANPMPHQLEGMKLADVSGARQRDFMRAMLLAAVVGAVGAFWTYLHTAYQLGAATARVESWPRSFPYENYTQLDGWFRTRDNTNVESLEAAAAGFVLAAVLGALRQRLAWFPFHPLAYAVANSWGMTQLWMPICCGSLVKIILLRYGSLRLYRQAVPFFLGLILGEMIVGGLWTLYGIAFGIRAYDFWP